MKLKVMRGGFVDGPVLATEDGEILPGQIAVEVLHGLKKLTVRVEFVIDNLKVKLALDETVNNPVKVLEQSSDELGPRS